MERNSESDESDADFVPDEKESDLDSDTRQKRKTGSPQLKRSKRLKTKSDTDDTKEEKRTTKTQLEEPEDKKYEDDLWKSFLDDPKPANSAEEPKVEAVEIKEVKAPVKQNKSGLSSVLNKLNKGSKLSTLEKSKLDWNSFKKDEGIEEELTTYNRGKEGYLERQDFLQRTDVRQFEIEKNVRAGKRGFR